MRKLTLFCAFFFLISGCVCVQKDVVLVAMDVANVQDETSTALIRSIDADLENPNHNEADKKALEDLKERLNYLKRATRAVSRGMTESLSVEELAEIIKKGHSLY